jgi:hypothetical protein
MFEGILISNSHANTRDAPSPTLYSRLTTPKTSLGSLPLDMVYDHQYAGSTSVQPSLAHFYTPSIFIISLACNLMIRGMMRSTNLEYIELTGMPARP